MPLERPRIAKLIATAELNTFTCVMLIVVFALLACCMTTLGNHHTAISIDLPHASHSISVGGLTWGANRHDAMFVAVTREGSIFMNNDRVLAPTHTAKIKRNLSEGAERKLYIRADAHAPYSSVKTVLDAAQSVGVQEVSFLTFQ
jgi:biopolymer transport protein TolR